MKYTQITIEMSAEEMRASRNIGQNIMELLARATEPAPIEPEDEDEEEEDEEDQEDKWDLMDAYNAGEHPGESSYITAGGNKASFVRYKE